MGKSDRLLSDSRITARAGPTPVLTAKVPVVMGNGLHLTVDQTPSGKRGSIPCATTRFRASDGKRHTSGPQKSGFIGSRPISRTRPA